MLLCENIGDMNSDDGFSILMMLCVYISLGHCVVLLLIWELRDYD